MKELVFALRPRLRCAPACGSVEGISSFAYPGLPPWAIARCARFPPALLVASRVRAKALTWRSPPERLASRAPNNEARVTGSADALENLCRSARAGRRGVRRTRVRRSERWAARSFSHPLRTQRVGLGHDVSLSAWVRPPAWQVAGWLPKWSRSSYRTKASRRCFGKNRVSPSLSPFGSTRSGR